MPSLALSVPCGDRSGTETVVTGIMNPQEYLPGSILMGLQGIYKEVQLWMNPHLSGAKVEE